jgi:hypothetical protein
MNQKQAEKLLRISVHCMLACKPTSPSNLFAKGLAVDLPKWHSHIATTPSLVAATYHWKKKVNLITSFFKARESEHVTV